MYQYCNSVEKMWNQGWTWPPIILLLHHSAPQESFCLPVCLFSQVNDEESTVGVEFTPTIPHCSMATLIGLSIKVKLLRSLPERFKVHMSMCVCLFEGCTFDIPSFDCWLPSTAHHAIYSCFVVWTLFFCFYSDRCPHHSGESRLRGSR